MVLLVEKSPDTAWELSLKLFSELPGQLPLVLPLEQLCVLHQESPSVLSFELL